MERTVICACVCVEINSLNEMPHASQKLAYPISCSVPGMAGRFRLGFLGFRPAAALPP